MTQVLGIAFMYALGVSALLVTMYSLLKTSIDQ